MAPGSGAPLRVPLRLAGTGHWDSGRQALCAASLPARRFPTRWRRRPRQTMNLERAELWQVWARTPPQASSLQARSPVGGVPFAVRSWLCPARSGSLREGLPVAAPGLTRPLPRQSECGPSSETENRVLAWWRCGQLEAGGGRTPRGTHRLAVPQNRPKESEFARPWVH